MTKENPFEHISKIYKKNKILECTVTDKIENGILVRIPETEVDAFLHQNQLSWNNDSKAQYDKIKKGEKISCKIVDISVENRKILVSKKHLKKIQWNFGLKKVDDIVTTKVVTLIKKD